MIVLIVNQPHRQTWFSGELQDLPMITSPHIAYPSSHIHLLLLLTRLFLEAPLEAPTCRKSPDTCRWSDDEWYPCETKVHSWYRSPNSLVSQGARFRVTYCKDVLEGHLVSLLLLKQARDVDHFGKPFNLGYPTDPSNHSKSCGIMWYPFLYNRACDIDVHHVGTCNVLCVHQQPASSI